ncbi:AraC family transcriptional regulator [Burkholderia sp. MR1-5-21]
MAFLNDAGIATGEALAGSGINEEDLVEPRRIIAPEQEQIVFANVLRLSATPAPGLAMGFRARISAYGVLGYAMLSAATFEDAWQIGLAYPVLLGTYFSLRMQKDQNLACITATGYKEAESLRAFNTELCLGSLKVMFSDLLGRSLPLKCVQVDYPGSPEMQDAYTEGFGCPVEFNAERCAIFFESSWLAQRLPLAEILTHTEMLAQCHRQNSELASSRVWLEHVRALLASCLRQPPGQEELARQLNCSSRSLRRHLAQHKTSYQQLLDELRFDRAKQMLLQSNLPIYRIAEEVGFRESANLRQAFMRWTGQSPSSFRGQ